MGESRNIDICKILKGQEGIELYTDHFNWGKCKFLYIDNYLNTIVVEVTEHGGPFYFEFDKYGVRREFNGSTSCLYPSKEERDWSKFEKPIPEGTPMMCRNKSTLPWILCNYVGKINNKHCVKYYKNSKESEIIDFNYTIPFDKFDPNDIEKSLKNNVQIW